MELFLVFLLGAAASLLANYLWEQRRALRQRVRQTIPVRYRQSGGVDYDSQQHGLYMLNSWSPKSNRALLPGQLIPKWQADRPTQDWLPDAALSQRAEYYRARGETGDVCYLVEHHVDHHEGRGNLAYIVTFCPADYAEHLAVQDVLAAYPDAQLRIKRTLQHAPERYLENAVPSAVAMNVVVSDHLGRLLAVRRSLAVDTAKGLWTLGVVETMKWQAASEPGTREDFFALGERGLREELGLEVGVHYDRVDISWFGIYLPLLRGHVVGHARLKVDSDTVMQSFSAAEHRQEADHFGWVSLSRRFVSGMLSSPNFPSGNDPHLRFRYSGREWVDTVRLSAYEALRLSQG